MKTMKAIRIHTFGGPEVLLLEEQPRPVPGPGEVLVRVRAAGVLATDWEFRAGLMPGFLGLELPLIPGWDISGIVEAVGPGVTDFQIGKDVYAMLPGQGGYAEYAVVNTAILASKPAALDYIQAAAVPSAACTAYKSLYEVAGLSGGQTLLVHGASGGVGSFAIQLAKAKGAKVIAMASARKADFVRSLGADEVFDYTQSPFEEHLGEIDAVFDTVGGETQERSFKVLKSGGMLVTIAGGRPPSPDLALQFGVRAEFVGTEPDGARLAAITALIDAGKLKPAVNQVLPLAEVRQAHELLQNRQARGKIVLQVSE